MLLFRYSGEAIRKLRLLKGLSQKGVAVELGITQQAYSKLEKKEKIPERKFLLVSKTLGYSIEELYTLSLIC